MTDRDLIILKKELSRFEREYGHKQEDDMKRSIKKVIDRIEFTLSYNR